MYLEITDDEIIVVIIISLIVVSLFNLRRIINILYPNRDKTTIQCVSEEKFSYGNFVIINGVIKEYPCIEKIKVSQVDCTSEYYMVVDVTQYNDMWKYTIKCFNQNTNKKIIHIKKESN